MSFTATYRPLKAMVSRGFVRVNDLEPNDPRELGSMDVRDRNTAADTCSPKARSLGTAGAGPRHGQ